MEATNKILSIIGFYLSEYDMDAVKELGFRTRSEAIRIISSKIGNGNNYLKLRRDEFDALPDSASTRKGWRNRPPIKDVVEMAEYLHQFSFNELTEIVRSLIENHGENELLGMDSISGSIDDIPDEDKIEQLINSEDDTAKVVITLRSSKQRVYNKGIITQLKKLYKGCCQICGYNPSSEYDVDICEAHHIEFFSHTQNNNASNIVVLCPNHHRLIHALQPEFRKESLVFVTENGQELPIVMNYHLRG